MGKKGLAVLLGVVTMVGLKVYSSASAHDEARESLVALCDGEGVCERAVEAHFDACFDSAHGRRQSARLETDQLVQCLNSKADRVYFVYGER